MQKGGKQTAKTHDKDFYEKIGEKGGEKTADTHDKDFYKKIGRKGGKAIIYRVTIPSHYILTAFLNEVNNKSKETIRLIASFFLNAT